MATTVTSTTPAGTATPAAGAGRLISLDIFRGATIAAMILVNNAGDWNHVYAPLRHAEWHGWTPTDLIFPFFLFIVGVSMVLSFEARRRRGATRGQLLRHAVERSAIIFAIGMVLNAAYLHLETIRIMGVLQRIALAYLAAAVITLYCDWRGRAAALAGLLIGYWLVMTHLPGYDLSPDGNLASVIDRQLFYNHLWVPHHRDPEGLLSTLPAIASALIGVFAGEWLQKGVSTYAKFRGMLAAGAIGLALGKLWGLWFPINKNIWTSSYVVFTGGFALVLLALCWWAVEIRGWRRWGAPFVWYGSNAITVYALSSLTENLSVSLYTTWAGQRVTWKTYLYERFFAPLAQPIHASLLWALAYVLAFWVLAWIMYRKKIFIKI